MRPDHAVLIDIDGLRPDAFVQALEASEIPNLAYLLGGDGVERGLLVEAVSPAPSITFCSQASLFTGAHPAGHGVLGNQFYDRFGRQSEGTPRHYAFDIGDTLSYDDAVRVFTEGLADQRLEARTVYQAAAEQGLDSVVVGNMYFRGAHKWLSPSIVDLGRLTKGGDLFGLDPDEYDRRTLENALEYIQEHSLPSILTVYWKGLDDVSHREGPDSQRRYLSEVVDKQVGELWQGITEALKPGGERQVLCAIFSDHGQIGVPSGESSSLRLSFPFERDMVHLFDALGLDLHDFPGEDPNCDAVVASNGGLAYVYLQNKTGRWGDVPVFERDVLPVGQAFWEAHQTGRYAPELEGTLNGVLIRSVERDGWRARFQALTPSGEIVPLEAWFQNDDRQPALDPVNRLNNLASPYAGDLILVSSYQGGFYFAPPVSGVHGGLHPDDSYATLAFGWPTAPAQIWQEARTAIEEAIRERCQQEGGRMASTADLATGLYTVLGLRM